MNPKDLIRNILQDAKVKLVEEFDRNFGRKGFFNQKWPATKHQYSRGSLMMRSGKLRRGINAKVQGSSIVISNSMPYAAIHNEGGEVKVTAKMKRYFWAMHYKADGAITKTKSGRDSASQRNKRLSDEAAKWKAMALLKVGTTIKIEQRQFIGHHPKLDNAIKKIVDYNVKELAHGLGNQMRRSAGK
jgi:phage gpG-like protein